MRTFIRAIQILVGVLFIFSGLVKANDPLGLSYKMQEFFELWNSSLTGSSFFLKSPLIALLDGLHHQSLVLSVVLITLEIVTGVALLLAWQKRAILWLLLLLIIFFTFLTGYAYLSGRFTNCGCFGDCLPITPLTSFIKDILLLALIMLLLIGQRFVTPVLSPKARVSIMVGSVLASVALQWFVLHYLPLADCLPFKRGNNIAQQMQPPKGAVPDSFAIRFIYEKAGKRYEFSPEGLPADFDTYTFIDRKQTLVRKGNAEPAIKGFSLVGVSGVDSTQAVLEQPKAILVFTQNNIDETRRQELQKVAGTAKARDIPVYIASPSLTNALLNTGGTSNMAQYFNTDFTVVRTAARTEPTVLILEKGTIIKKYSAYNMAQAVEDIHNSKP